ncbi:MAG TPA: hemerythrin domain-containing protein [Myxococcales bacterium]|nr:hemerythrin domain-containing protein [Myxococcales bacterium]HET9753916.1 hemerythrin domain-containing protein [Myxococcales bacterium]
MRATQLLMEEHEIILRGLRVLEALADRAIKGAEVPARAVDQALDFLGQFADLHHHHKEEEILFPALEEAGVPGEGGPVGVMLHEHDQGRKLISALRAAAAGAAGDAASRARFADTARAYSALLSGHIEKENHVLFPMADQALQGQERRRVDEEFDAFENTDAARRDQQLGVVARLSRELL